MRNHCKAALLSAVVASLVLPAAPELLAADLAVTPTKRARVVHHRVRVVRDYDGTPIALRPAPPILVRGVDGVLVRRPVQVAHALERATPTRYLNGQPVWPTTRIAPKLRVRRLAAYR